MLSIYSCLIFSCSSLKLFSFIYFNNLNSSFSKYCSSFMISSSHNFFHSHIKSLYKSNTSLFINILFVAGKYFLH
ncbi:MAG: hypothetical protein Q8S84_08380 [bacterium]|nr:hypothetical protein [bacterium]